MTINSDTRKAGPYLGDGTTVTLPFGFKMFQASDLRVVRTSSAGVETDLVLGSDYTATLNANQDTTPGGSITLATPAATGTRTTIGSAIAPLQKIQLANNGGFYAETLNGGLDRLTILLQQVIEEQGRSLRVPFSDIAGGTEMAASTDRANKVLGFDSSGRPAYVVPTSGSAADVALQLASLITDLASSSTGKGDALLAVLRSATGAQATTQHEVNDRGSLHLYDFIDPAIRANVAAAIAAGSATYAVQVTAALNAAKTAAAAAGFTLRLPPGVIYLTPATPIVDETGGPNTCAVQMVSHMHIRGEPGYGTTLKITAGVSSDASPKLHSMFLSNQQLVDISITDLVLDMNGANNPISPARPTTYNVYTQAHILFSGTPGGLAAGGTDVTIERVRFLNTAGVTCIGCAQTNSSGVALGKGWRIRDCKFLNNGLDTIDHSSIYLWCDDAQVTGCTFGADTMWGTVGKSGALVAIEIHGADQFIIGNKISNYYQGLWLATNRTSDTQNVVVAFNSIGPVKGIGIDTYRESATEMGIHDVVIAHNTIELTDDATVINLKACVQIVPTYKVSDILVADNIGRKAGTTVASVFGSVGPQAVAGQKHTGITFRGNKGRGFAAGILMSTNATNGLGRLVLESNEFYDLVGAGVLTTPIGISGANISAANPVDFLRIAGNTVIGAATQYGTYLSGAIGILDLDHSAYSVTVAGHYEIGLTVTRREGFHNSVDFTPAWKSSGAAITPASVKGAYNLDGDMVTVNAQVTIGGTAVPAGTLQLTLPLVSSPTNIQYMGAWRIFDTSAGTWRTGVAEIDGTASIATLNIDNGTNATNASPVALATGDVISVQIDYRRA